MRSLHTSVCVDNSNKDIYLKIDTNNLRRTFSYSYNDKDYNKVVTLDNVYYLCDEGICKGKRFTGAMIGMYATLEIMEAGILTAREDTEQMIIMRHLIISDIKHKIMSTKVLILKVSCETL